ncbi:MAG: class I SAM-dependent methyltransferase [bacterium]|nr:class I SAM-dependent methyltransferase [bacterium]
MKYTFLKNLWVEYGDTLGKTVFHPQYFTVKAASEGIELAKKYSRGTLLDIGCGRMPYRVEIEPLVDTYLGLDHPQVSKLYGGRWKPDILADVIDIPLKGNTIDTVLLLQVLEHLDDPKKALAEIFRILRPGGFVIGALPFLYPIHDSPYDMARYTEQMLRKLFISSGFQIVLIKAEGSFIGQIVQSINVFFMTRIKDILHAKMTIFSFFYLLFLVVISPISIIVLNFFGALLLFFGTFLPKYPNYFPIDYSFVLHKPVKGINARARKE